jgi:hypothetical protein
VAVETDAELRELIRTTNALLSHGATVESASGSAHIAATDLTEAIARATSGPPRGPGATLERSEPSRADVATAAAVVARANSALSRTENGESLSRLTDDDVSALELIVETIGRPALRYRSGRVETPPNRLGDNSRWFVLVATQRKEINELSSRVGRVACQRGSASPVLGTGWRLAEDLVITNRHVASELATDRNAPPETWTIDAAKSPFIDFAYTDDAAAIAPYAITELVYCAKKGDIDLAVLRITANNDPLPPPIAIEWERVAVGRNIPDASGEAHHFQGGEVYAVGHPYQLQANAAIRGVFGQADGRKRWSPGLVTKIETEQPLMWHDCSTLGGNSGSCIVAIGARGHAAVGLHFGGREGDRPAGSGLGVSNAAIAFAWLGDHPAAAYLRC